MTGVVLVNDNKEERLEFELLRSSLRISFFDAIAMKDLLYRQWNGSRLAGRLDMPLLILIR